MPATGTITAPAAAVTSKWAWAGFARLTVVGPVRDVPLTGGVRCILTRCFQWQFFSGKLRIVYQSPSNGRILRQMSDGLRRSRRRSTGAPVSIHNSLMVHCNRRNCGALESGIYKASLRKGWNDGLRLFLPDVTLEAAGKIHHAGFV
jgi:hypothetical protein